MTQSSHAHTKSLQFQQECIHKHTVCYTTHNTTQHTRHIVHSRNFPIFKGSGHALSFPLIHTPDRQTGSPHTHLINHKILLNELPNKVMRAALWIKTPSHLAGFTGLHAGQPDKWQHLPFTQNGEYSTSHWDRSHSIEVVFRQICTQVPLVSWYLPKTDSRDRPRISLFILKYTWCNEQIWMDSNFRFIHSAQGLRVTCTWPCSRGISEPIGSAGNRQHTAYFLHQRCGHIKFDNRLSNSSLYLQLLSRVSQTQHAQG